MQFSALDYPVFILTIISLFLFGVLYAAFVRHLARQSVEGQTAYLVVVGVGVTLLGATAVIGIETALLLFACFAASGLPMVVEYILRMHLARRRDQEQAKQAARDLLQ
jgi:hypothetical protein